MAVTYQNKAEVKVLSETSITIPVPVGFSTGDLLIALVAKDDDPAITIPEGWTLIQAADDINSTGCYFSVSYRIAQEGDTEWTWNGDNEDWFGVILRYTGHDLSTPINISGITRGDITSTPTAPSVATTKGGCIILVAFGADNNDIPYTVPSATIERFNDVTTTTGGAGADVAQKALGDSGAKAFGMAANEQWVAVTVAIQPYISAGVTTGRSAVGTYRADHDMLYTGGWYKGISEDHTPLLNQLLTALEAQGFSTLQEFFDASREVGDEWR